MSYRNYRYYDLYDDDEDFYDYYMAPRRTYTYYSSPAVYSRPSTYSADITLTPTYHRLSGKRDLSYVSPVASSYNYGYRIPSVAFDRVTRVSEPPHSLVTASYPRMTNMEKYAQSIRPSSPYLDDYLYSPRVDSIFDQLHDMKLQTSAVLAKYTRRPRTHVRTPDTSYYPRNYLSYVDYDVTSPIKNSRRTIERFSHHDKPVTHYRIDDISRDYRPRSVLDGYEPTYSTKSIGSGNLAAVRYAGDKAHSRRRTPAISDEDRVSVNVKNLSYYIHKKRAAGAEEKIPGWGILEEYYRIKPVDLSSLYFSHHRKNLPSSVRVPIERRRLVDSTHYPVTLDYTRPRRERNRARRATDLHLNEIPKIKPRDSSAPPSEKPRPILEEFPLTSNDPEEITKVIQERKKKREQLVGIKIDDIKPSLGSKTIADQKTYEKQPSTIKEISESTEDISWAVEEAEIPPVKQSPKKSPEKVVEIPEEKLTVKQEEETKLKPTKKKISRQEKKKLSPEKLIEPPSVEPEPIQHKEPPSVEPEPTQHKEPPSVEPEPTQHREPLSQSELTKLNTPEAVETESLSSLGTEVPPQSLAEVESNEKSQDIAEANIISQVQESKAEDVPEHNLSVIGETSIAETEDKQENKWESEIEKTEVKPEAEQLVESNAVPNIDTSADLSKIDTVSDHPNEPVQNERETPCEPEHEPEPEPVKEEVKLENEVMPPENSEIEKAKRTEEDDPWADQEEYVRPKKAPEVEEMPVEESKEDVGKGAAIMEINAVVEDAAQPEGVSEDDPWADHNEDEMPRRKSQIAVEETEEMAPVADTTESGVIQPSSEEMDDESATKQVGIVVEEVPAVNVTSSSATVQEGEEVDPWGDEGNDGSTESRSLEAKLANIMIEAQNRRQEFMKLLEEHNEIVTEIKNIKKPESEKADINLESGS